MRILSGMMQHVCPYMLMLEIISLALSVWIYCIPDLDKYRNQEC